MTVPENSIEIKTISELTEWLEENSSQKNGVWLITHKISSKEFGKIPYDDIVSELLCQGWIDSLPRKLDDNRSMLWISPRKPSSAWSKKNKEKINELMDQGRIRMQGLRIIEEAKRNGNWDKLNDIEEGIIPEDLIEELQKHSNAFQNFNNFPKSVKKSILEWIIQAKTSETRKKRISETSEKAAENIRANQWKEKKK